MDSEGVTVPLDILTATDVVRFAVAAAALLAFAATCFL